MGLWGGCLGLRGVWWCWVSGSLAAALKDPCCRWRVGGPLSCFSSFHTCTHVGCGLGMCVSSTPRPALHKAPSSMHRRAPSLPTGHSLVGRDTIGVLPVGCPSSLDWPLLREGPCDLGGETAKGAEPRWGCSRQQSRPAPWVPVWVVRSTKLLDSRSLAFPIF